MVLAASALLALSQANSAMVPATRPGGWMTRHEAMNARVAKGNVDLILVGDSITHAWGGEPNTGENFAGRGKDSYDYYFGDRNTVNLGISGDRTQHVLYRLENGNLKGIDPKVAVVMIGTNNMAVNDRQQIAEGVQAVCQSIHRQCPKTKVLLLAIFPRNSKGSELRTRVVSTNALLKTWAAEQSYVKYADIGSIFLQANQELKMNLLPDQLHPFAEGYSVWGEALEPILAPMLGQSPKPPR